MNKDELLKQLREKEESRNTQTCTLEDFSTTQLKAELRRRKKERYRGK